jgi:NAD(P)-dependent dehydrogenase (short-subunit alcohol dehydrogenase family)
MDHIVITGASRGIGLGLAEISLGEGHRVAAFSRNPKDSKELLQLKEKFPESLELYSVDVSSEDAAKSMRVALSQWEKIDLLFNNAGVAVSEDNQQAFVESFKTNSIAPYLVIQALKDLLKKSSFPKVINTSSLMGSIADNSSGGSVVYRSSKSALNMIVKCLSLDHPEITSIVLHPGWVNTQMGGSGAPTEVRESCEGIWRLQKKIKKSDSGQFFDFKSRSLPW